jgi:hypothetical protein
MKCYHGNELPCKLCLRMWGEANALMAEEHGQHADPARIERETEAAIQSLVGAAMQSLADVPNEWLDQVQKEIAELERMWRL